MSDSKLARRELRLTKRTHGWPFQSCCWAVEDVHKGVKIEYTPGTLGDERVTITGPAELLESACAALQYRCEMNRGRLVAS